MDFTSIVFVGFYSEATSGKAKNYSQDNDGRGQECGHDWRASDPGKAMIEVSWRPPWSHDWRWATVEAAQTILLISTSAIKLSLCLFSMSPK